MLIFFSFLRCKSVLCGKLTKFGTDLDFNKNFKNFEILKKNEFL